MTKEKHNDNSYDEIFGYSKKIEFRIIRILWFTLGFLTAVFITFIVMSGYE